LGLWQAAIRRGFSFCWRKSAGAIKVTGMSDPHHSGPDPGDAAHEELQSAVFAQMVLQQVNLAMMLLGKAPHPQTGQKVQDIEGARMFIDQLEMLEAKTKGNLSRDESQLLKQSLMSLHLAFVEAVESPAPAPADTTAAASPPPAAAAAGSDEAKSEPPPAGAADDSRKKFSKKY
jgi:hypothetical protein